MPAQILDLHALLGGVDPDTERTLSTLRAAWRLAEKVPGLLVGEAVRSVHPHEVPDSDSRQFIPLTVLVEETGYSPEGECAGQLADILDHADIDNPALFIRRTIERIEAGIAAKRIEQPHAE